jgi:hypothetical protein
MVIGHERVVRLPARRTRPVRLPGRPPSQTLPSAADAWTCMACRGSSNPQWSGSGHGGGSSRRHAAAVPSTHLGGFDAPSAPSSLSAASVGRLKGAETRRGARNLCRTFPTPPHSAPSVPNLPGEDRPRRPQPLGLAGGRLRAPLNGASGAGGLRCWRDLPNDTPRSSALLARRSGPLVKAAHPSSKKNPGDAIFFRSRAGPRWRRSSTVPGG